MVIIPNLFYSLSTPKLLQKENLRISTPFAYSVLSQSGSLLKFYLRRFLIREAFHNHLPKVTTPTPLHTLALGLGYFIHSHGHNLNFIWLNHAHLFPVSFFPLKWYFDQTRDLICLPHCSVTSTKRRARHRERPSVNTVGMSASVIVKPTEARLDLETDQMRTF